MRTNTFVAVLPLVAALVGCSEQQFVSVAERPGEGDLTLSGRVCDTTRNTWLEGAMVYTHLIDSDGVLYSTRTVATDVDGYWTMEGMAADFDYTIYVQHGSQLLDLFEVSMGSDDIVLPDPPCLDNAEVEVAVVTGDYDDFGEVLTKLGVADYKTVNGTTGEELRQFLLNTESLMTYDAIFFPGGHIEEDVVYDSDGSDTAGKVAEVKDALRAYVEAGGVIYASDWSYDVVEQVFPGRLDFLGDDYKPDDAQKGEPGTIHCEIPDTDLADAVGANKVDILFDLDAWPVVEDIGNGVNVHMTGDATYRVGFEQFTVEDAPLLVSFPQGDGRVVFSSWRQSKNADGVALDIIQEMIAGVE